MSWIDNLINGAGKKGRAKEAPRITDPAVQAKVLETYRSVTESAKADVKNMNALKSIANRLDDLLSTLPPAPPAEPSNAFLDKILKIEAIITEYDAVTDKIAKHAVEAAVILATLNELVNKGAVSPESVTDIQSARRATAEASLEVMQRILHLNTTYSIWRRTPSS